MRLFERLCGVGRSLGPEIEPRVVRILYERRLWRKLLNYLLVELQKGLRHTYALGRPYWLSVDPTSFCQLRCPFCPTGAERNVRPKASLPLEHFRHILDELGPYLLHIDFMNWGEPLLNREIYDMVAYAKRFEIDTMLSTNFNAFNEENAVKMVLSGLDRLVLSIDGTTQETYEKYRVRGSYPVVIENLKTLVRVRRGLGRKNPHIHWQFLVFKHNEHEIEKVRTLALELGADDVGITPAYLPFRPGIAEEWLPTQSEHRLYDPEKFPESPPWQWQEAQPMVDVKVYRDSEERRLCNWPWAGIAVNADGSVSPCCSVEEKAYDFGDYFGQPFSKLWNNPLYRQARRHVRDYLARKVDTLPNSSHACQRCFSIGKSRFQLPRWWFTEGGAGQGSL